MGAGASVSLCQTASSVRVLKHSARVEPESRIPEPDPGAVFGVPLSRLRDAGKLQHGVPLVVKTMVEFLEKYGLQQSGVFRVCGSAPRCRTLRVCLDRGERMDLERGDVPIVASLLKLYLRELPCGLIPNTHSKRMQQALMDSTDGTELSEALKQILTRLPDDNYNILSYLLHFLSRVAAHSQWNHMTSENLATVFGPCIFRVPEGPRMLEEQTVCNTLTLYLLEKHSHLIPDTHTHTHSGDFALPLPLLADMTQIQEEQSCNQGTMCGISVEETKDMRAHQLTAAETQPLSSSGVEKESEAKKEEKEEGIHPKQESCILEEDQSCFACSDTSPSLLQRAVEPPSPNNNNNNVHLYTHPGSNKDTESNNTHSETRNKTHSKSRKTHSGHTHTPNSAHVTTITPFKPRNTHSHSSESSHTLSESSILHPQSNHTHSESSHTLSEASHTLSESSISHPQSNHTHSESSHTLSENSISHPQSNHTHSESSHTLSESSISHPQSNHTHSDSSHTLSENSISHPQSNHTHPESSHTLSENSISHPQSNHTHPESSHTLSENSISHTQSNHTHSESSHTLSESSISHTQSNHTHSESSHTLSENSISHTQSNHTLSESSISHMQSNHTHSKSSHTHTNTAYTHTEEEPRPASICEQSSHNSRAAPVLKAASAQPSPHCLILSQNQHISSQQDSASSSQSHIMSECISSGNSADSSSETSIALLQRHIHSLKQAIRSFDDSFQHNHNYKAGHSDKTAEFKVASLKMDLCKARKQLKELRSRQCADGLKKSCSSSAVLQAVSVPEAKPALEDTVKTLTQHLKEKRMELNLPDRVQDMSLAQLALEKITLQKSLLYYESLHGRPRSREERSVMRELYDRYRSVKQAFYTLNKHTSTTGKDADSDMCIQQPLCSMVSMPAQEDSNPAFISRLEEEKQPTAPTNNTQAVNRAELLRQLRATREEKRRMRKILKEYEETVLLKTGRRAQKEDRVPMAAEYDRYKTLKARLKLLKSMLGKTHTQKTAR
ncbi:protein FAM13B-like [Colossoma macropomum]|uniref:protein FAM13B-like n=1 Tax=Colossoma macropomum TaxID=42526 RepID=UPI00186514AE|nr:protein FAM13B-like [Colossoma macropomum]